MHCNKDTAPHHALQQGHSTSLFIVTVRALHLIIRCTVEQPGHFTWSVHNGLKFGIIRFTEMCNSQDISLHQHITVTEFCIIQFTEICHSQDISPHCPQKEFCNNQSISHHPSMKHATIRAFPLSLTEICDRTFHFTTHWDMQSSKDTSPHHSLKCVTVRRAFHLITQ